MMKKWGMMMAKLGDMCSFPAAPAPLRQELHYGAMFTHVVIIITKRHSEKKPMLPEYPLR